MSVLKQKGTASKPPQAEALEELKNAGGGPTRVLLVDHHPEFVTLASGALEKNGFAVSAARSVQGATDLLSDSKKSFDAVVTNFMFDQGNGIDVVKKARERGIPGVLVSTVAGTQEAVEEQLKRPLEKDEQPAAILKKPVHRDTLIQTLKNVTQKGGRQTV